MTIFTAPVVQVIDPDTLMPASGALLYFLVTGGTVGVGGDLRDTYTTSAHSVANANPVVCSAEGLSPAIYCDDAITYKVVAKTAGGTTLWTRDPYIPAGKPSTPFRTISGASNTVLATDTGKILRRTHSSAMSDTFPTAASVGDGFFTTLRNTTSAFNITVTVASAGTIDGASSLIIYPGQDRTIRSNGAVYYADPPTQYLGDETISIPAAAWEKSTTNPCGDLTKGETATDDVDYRYLPFGGTVDQSCFVELDLPLSYLPGSLEYRVRWSAASGTPGQTCIWGLEGVAYQDNNPLDALYGALAQVSDALLTASYLHVTAWTAFAPTDDEAGKFLALKLTRDASADTLTADVVLLSVQLRFNHARPTEAS